MDKRKVRNLVLIILGLLIITAGGSIVSLYTDWLWFKAENFSSVFMRILLAKIELFFIFSFLFFLIVGFNVYLSRRLKPRGDLRIVEENLLEMPNRYLYEPYINSVLIGGLLIFSFLIGLGITANWHAFLCFLNSTPFALSDPLFKQNLSFYIFKLPLLKYLYIWLMFALGLSLLVSILIYIFQQGIQVSRQEVTFARGVKAHLSILSILLLFLKAYGYKLSIYNLLYSSRGIVFGATYTDVHAQLPVLKFLLIMALLCGLFILVSIFIRGWKIIAGGIGIIIVVSFLGGSVYPAIIQKFLVVPNEIVKESPYIDLNIKYTCLGYGLDKVERGKFPVEDTLSLDDIKKNDPTIRNIRLWDHRPLLSTYGQLQEIRTYYDFVAVDNDRYIINGQLTQTMLSPRELSSEKLPSKTWINERLTYTHGYGFCLGPVNKISEEGMPEFLVKDIPPQSTIPIEISRPEIYYGEIAGEYCFVKTKSKEFDYPLGDENVYSKYEGNGGVPVDSFLKKMFFALKFSEIKILFSGDITKKSRIMYYRKVSERLKKITPFITYEQDPYMVISEGKLYWICDGYTTSRMYPYSQPTPGLGNYIRNSIKAVVDVYSGKVSLYIIDHKDPLIQTYSKIFPYLFKPIKDMPKDLQAHIRYPLGLFSIQAQMWATYHMHDAQVFYNKEDLWKIPHEFFGGEEIEMQPYYTVLKFPEGKKEEFILMIPFTPAEKKNMIGWMAARCDSPNYGKLLVYEFPKQKLTFGPQQIEARIDQDTEISQQLTLWGQSGSEVVRGNLLVIPIEKSLIYVEPLYLSATASKLPQLKRVIVAFGNKLAMEKSLELCLQRLFGGEIIPEKKEVKSKIEVSLSRQELTEKAWGHLSRAKSYQREGNWAGYGKELRDLEEVLKKLKE